ncbi:LysR family transcriptional regulator [Stappia sp. BW2]|uniref:LysR family transcriptional regulator n=1 Tax=Stappia sp. BW2 TaxID=2592622 RepID=UPI0011DE8586|nr:LysR family transcriptional regulator [Stappia sp. BW2]TYC78351.1 LysR family transcriptional regulator [Stappia sp. BW2]
MDRFTIHGIDVFLAIVREGSMRAAAEKLGVGAPAVTLQLKSLEERLGVDLLVRTTRSLELTEAGQILFDSASPAMRDLGSAIERAQQAAKSTVQVLRLSLSRGAYLVAVAPMLPSFLSDHPEVSLEISWNEELVDIQRKGFHAGVRLGDVLSADMAAIRASAGVPSAFFASPSYLKAHETPQKPRDLLDHACIRHRHPTSGQLREWWVSEGKQTKRIDPPARLVFDSAAGVIQAARESHGIGWSMRATMEDHLETGELELVLDGYATELPPFYLYFPEQNADQEPLRSFISAVNRHLATDTKS